MNWLTTIHLIMADLGLLFQVWGWAMIITTLVWWGFVIRGWRKKK